MRRRISESDAEMGVGRGGARTMRRMAKTRRRRIIETNEKEFVQ